MNAGGCRYKDRDIKLDIVAQRVSSELSGGCTKNLRPKQLMTLIISEVTTFVRVVHKILYFGNGFEFNPSVGSEHAQQSRA